VDRRTFLGTLASLFVSPLAAEAQPSGKVYRIGFLEAGAPDVNGHFLDAFKRGLREAGYAEGKDIIIEERWANGQNDRFPALLGELIQLNVDLIVAASTPGALAAKAATATIPIVFVGAVDPLGNGLVKSLGRPGGNVTGFSQADEEGFVGKRLELLKQAVPKMTRVAVLWNPMARGVHLRLNETRTAATKLGVTLRAFEVRDMAQLESAFTAMARERMGGLIVLSDPWTVRHRVEIADLAAKARMPAMYQFGEFARAGGLMSYGPSVPELFRRAAAYVDKILKGAKPADLPVEQPTKFELVVNLRAAQALGLTIPQSLMLRADDVIR
jgi:putative ABC transport system substrate-binding protein